MKAVLISIRPKWCEKIISGEKTIEVRKTRPKLNPPFKCYIYCTQSADMLWILKERERSLHPDKIADVFKAAKCGGAYRGNGKIIGEFLCDQIININGAERIPSDAARPTCLEPVELHQYLGAATGFGWHISNLKIYDTPRELDDFRRACKNDWWCESCAMYSENNGTCGNGSLQIRRPPQSWCYVKEQKWND